VIGDVLKVHSWTDRPISPQGVKGFDHSKFIPVDSPTLDCGRWLSLAAPRDFDPT